MPHPRRPFRRLHAPLAHLALMAMLAMAMLPALGRIGMAASGGGTGADDGIARALAAMCMPSGLGENSPALIAVKDSTALHGPALPNPYMPLPEPGEDCAYCLLQHVLDVPASVATCLPPPPHATAAVVPAPTVHTAIAVTGGSGPRGPPHPLS